VPIDQESFFEGIEIGDKIAIDYGQVIMTVIDIEDHFLAL